MPMPDSPLKIGFNVPFSEAIKAAQQRGVVLPDVYYGTLQGLARQQSFSIAGVASLDQLTIVRDSLSAKLQNGQTFKQWQKDILESGTLELPRYRMENIFRTNIQSNYNRGRWERFVEVKSTRPYLMYDAINDSRVRPTHLAMDGIIRPVGDPFWNTHAPLNGYQCRCRLISLSEGQAQARSGADTKNQKYYGPEGQELPQVQGGHGLNKVIDEEGMKPDKGFDYNPGEDLLAGVNQGIASRATTAPAKLVQALNTKLASNIPKKLDDYIALGKTKADGIINSVGSGEAEFRKELNQLLNNEIGTDISANVINYGSRSEASKLVVDASKLLPNSWTKAIDDFGSLTVRESTKRAFAVTANQDYTGKIIDFKKIGFGIQKGSKNAGFIVTNKGSLSTALHELSHRVQSAIPELDQIFQDLHKRRTSGDSLKRLADIYPFSGYEVTEVCKEDHYINAYFGKEYAGEAKEVMTMSIESVMAGKYVFNELLSKDRELFDLVVGLLFHYEP